MERNGLEFSSILLVDGPNMESSKLVEILNAVKLYGDPLIKEVFFKRDVASEIVGAYMNHGFTAYLNRTARKDVDTYLSTRADELIMSPEHFGKYDLLAIASKDGDFVPTIKLARKFGLKTLVIGSDDDEMSLELKRATDFFEPVGYNGFRGYTPRNRLPKNYQVQLSAKVI